MAAVRMLVVRLSIAGLVIFAGACSTTKSDEGDCGDDVAEGTEACDGADLDGEDCVSRGYAGGTLGCTATCTFDETACTAATCGDGVVSSGEACDGTDLGGADCVSLGFAGGVLACSDGCAFDTSGCDAAATCGDGVIDAGEDCDGANLGSQTCVGLGYTDGELGCDGTCHFDESACTGGCGNDLVERDEQCDGTDLAGEDCVSQGYAGGVLGCSADCTSYDFAGCTSGGDFTCDVSATECTVGDASTCACMGCNTNGACEADDDCVCDDCAEDAFCVDVANCNGDGVCDPYNEGCVCSDCFDHPLCDVAATCGNDTLDVGELCDGANLGGEDCVSQGFTDGTLGCDASCRGFDTSGCTGAATCDVSADTCTVGDPSSCTCVGCNTNGACEADDDCVCDDCTEDAYCADAANCNGDGVCDPYNEGCACSDCADHPLCDVATTCGNAALDMGETCDGDLLDGQDCVSQGYESGTLACAADCASFDFSGCVGGGGFSCDVTSTTCTAADASSCTCVGCNADDACAADDDCVCADCSADSYCGNPSNCNGDGVCDPYNEGCVCSDCFDHPLCDVSATCGNDTIDAGELCDGADLGGEDCLSRGFAEGTLGCDDTCRGFDTSGCSGTATCDVSAASCTVGDPSSCTCVGCVDDGTCTTADDCVCADCAADSFCGDAANCNGDGVCDPFNEGCVCSDCASHPLC